MASIGGISQRTVSGSGVETAGWPTPDEGALKDSARALYLSRKLAVRLYLAGAAANTIKEQCGIGLKQVYRLIRERCLEVHSDGCVYGWRGLVPHMRIKPYKRQKKIRVNQFGYGAVGALEELLDRHPELRQKLNARILSYPKGTKLQEAKLTLRGLYGWFLEQTRALGCEKDDAWPFCTASSGYYSIRRYMARLLATNPAAMAATAGGPNLVRKLKTGDGTRRPDLRFMQRVEMDAHKLDGRFCVSIPLIDGGTEEKIVHRLWVIVILEVTSRAVVGYYLSLRREVSADDVLRAIKRALSRWHLRDVVFANEPYVASAGLLSTSDDRFVGLCWDETSVDGALAETCARVKNTLHDVVGSVLLEPKSSFSVRRSLDDRPFIETFFRRLASGGFQRLSNTTGGKTEQRKGRDPDAVAITSKFQYEYAEELLDVLICNYNASPHKGISWKTPLEQARILYAGADAQYRYADATSVETTCSVRKLCRVQGGANKGRAPYVAFAYGRYTNEILQARHDLVGQKIWVVNHKEDDARVVLSSTVNGVSLGVLRAAPPWNKLPHSLAVRTAISQATARGQFRIPPGSDGVEMFLDFVEQQRKYKLPVHPAYLEARRILSSAIDLSVGEVMLERARAQTSTPLNGKLERQSQAPAQATDAKHGTGAPTLPPRRRAVTQS